MTMTHNKMRTMAAKRLENATPKQLVALAIVGVCQIYTIERDKKRRAGKPMTGIWQTIDAWIGKLR